MRALRAFNANEALTVLTADKDNFAVALVSSDYNQKIVAVLEDKAYKKLKKDPTDSVERKTFLLLKSPRLLRTFASNYYQNVPGHIDSMGS
jgi:hypothetical protein